MKPLSIDEFCESEGISRAYWYVLKARRETPVTYKLGRLTRISPAAYAAWHAAREAASNRIATAA